MAYPAKSGYLENEVLTATPERLVQMLYEAAIKAVAAARASLKTNDVSSRSRHINKAFAILSELMSGLDRDAGGEIAENYLRIYDYCQRRLLEAQGAQQDAPLMEIQSLLEDLNESWDVLVAKAAATHRERVYSVEAPGSLDYSAGSLDILG